MGVYKSLQCFRLKGGTKQRSNRFKYLIGKHDISRRFLDGVITSVSNCLQSTVCNVLNRPVVPYYEYLSEGIKHSNIKGMLFHTL